MCVQERLSLMASLRQLGLTYKQIGKHLGISKQRVHQLIGHLKIERVKEVWKFVSRKGNKCVDCDRKSRWTFDPKLARYLFKMGYSSLAIAKELGASVHRVVKDIKRPVVYGKKGISDERQRYVDSLRTK